MTNTAYEIPQYLEYELMRLGVEPGFIDEFSKSMGKLGKKEVERTLSAFEGVREYAKDENRIVPSDSRSAPGLGDLAEDPFSMAVIENYKYKKGNFFELDPDDERKERASFGQVGVHVESVLPGLRRRLLMATDSVSSNEYEEMSFKLDSYETAEDGVTKTYNGSYFYRNIVCRAGPGNKYDIAFPNFRGMIRMPTVVVPLDGVMEYFMDGRRNVEIDIGEDTEKDLIKGLVEKGFFYWNPKLETLESRRILNGYPAQPAQIAVTGQGSGGKS
jgi:hypothetical protein